MTVYMIVSVIIFTKYMLFRYTKLNDSKNRIIVAIKLNINETLYLLIFYLTIQEEMVIVLLQLTNPQFSDGINAFSFVLACLAAIHMLAMFRIILKAVFAYSYLDNYALKD